MNKFDWSQSQYKHQIPAIEFALQQEIAEHGSASLVPLTQKFRIPMVSMRSLVEAHQEQWGMLLNKPEDKVYPKKESEPIKEQEEECGVPHPKIK
jgi:hypothetical protein